MVHLGSPGPAERYQHTPGSQNWPRVVAVVKVSERAKGQRVEGGGCAELPASHRCKASPFHAQLDAARRISLHGPLFSLETSRLAYLTPLRLSLKLAHPLQEGGSPSASLHFYAVG